MMKKMKKAAALLMALMLVLALAACGGNEENPAGSMDMSGGETAQEQGSEESGEEGGETAAEAVDLAAAAKAYFNDMPDHIYKIGQQDFIDKVAAGDDMVILDIRQPDAYAEGHVKGAVNLPWGTAISDSLGSIPQDKEVFVYCYTGQTAGQAVATLNIAGINARSVNLGWNMGISKVEGLDAVTETAENTLPEASYPVAANVQEALDAYYAGLGEITDERFKNYKVSEDDLKAMIDGGEDFFLLSARKPADYAAGHIEGAVNIPYGKTMADNLAGVPTDKKVVVYCYTGQTAGQATAVLRLMGYDAVSLNGGSGMEANQPQGWVNKGYELVPSSKMEGAVLNYFANMPDHVYKIGQQDFIDKVAAGDDMVILDIRQPDAYAEGHVKGAVNLPWGTAISDSLSSIPQDKEVFVYCYTGQTAGQAVATLNIAGINARSVNLGWNMGISKTEGLDAVTETAENTLPAASYEVDAEIQAALDAYYAGLGEIADERFKNYKVSEDDLKAMIDGGEDFFLLSARKPADYAAGHIEGAVNIPFGNAMMHGIAAVPADKKVVVYCYTGQTAGQATAALRLMGYDAVSLNGGAGMEANQPQGWVNKGYELVAN